MDKNSLSVYAAVFITVFPFFFDGIRRQACNLAGTAYLQYKDSCDNSSEHKVNHNLYTKEVNCTLAKENYDNLYYRANCFNLALVINIVMIAGVFMWMGKTSSKSGRDGLRRADDIARQFIRESKERRLRRLGG